MRLSLTARSCLMFACLLAGTPIQAADHIRVRESVHQVKAIDTMLDGKPLRFEYLEFLPKQYADSDASFPLILFLHGGGAGGSDARELRGHHLPVVFEDKPGFPAIVISPQCPGGLSWKDEILDRLDELLAKVVAEHRVDTDRIYLTGLSMGGYGTWNMLRKHPKWFAAFLSVCGATGTEAGEMTTFAHIPGWATHGDMDMIVPIDVSRRAVDAFREAGGTIEMTTYPGVAHNAWEPAYDNPDLFLWLLNHKKGDPGYVYEMDEATRLFFDHWRIGQDYIGRNSASRFSLELGTAPIEISRTNTSRSAVTEAITWRTDNPHWTVSPQSANLDIASGKDSTASFVFTYTGGRHDLNPLPVFTSVLKIGDTAIKRFDGQLELDDKAFFRGRLQTHAIPSVGSAPIIDADLGDAAWVDVPHLSPLQNVDGTGPSQVAARVKIAYDATNLYVSIVIDEPNPAGLVHRHTERDASVFRDDNFSLFIQPDIEDDTYYHILVNPLGTIMDGRGHDRRWNADVKVQTAIAKAEWRAELAVPWASFGMTAPERGSRIGFNLDCARKQINALGQWTPTYGSGHQPNRFGQLICE